RDSQAHASDEAKCSFNAKELTKLIRAESLNPLLIVSSFCVHIFKWTTQVRVARVKCSLTKPTRVTFFCNREKALERSPRAFIERRALRTAGQLIVIHPAGSWVESVEDLEVARFRACLYEVKKQKRK
ncbi:hypothetical protein V1478_003997, partial [Vespula squamosa]